MASSSVGTKFFANPVRARFQEMEFAHKFLLAVAAAVSPSARFLRRQNAPLV